MIRTSILAAALLSATALVTVPAAAYTDDGGQGRQSRNWTGNLSGNTTSTTRTRRDTDSNQRDDTTTSSGSRDVPRRDTASNDGDDDNHGYRRHHHEAEGGLDPDEAARIRRAHEDSDGHVYMRRGHDEDGTPAYRSGYSTTYNGTNGREFEAPRHRRHHWWHAWWN